VDYRQRLEQGHGAFAALLRAWHERNGWSHRVLPALAEQLNFGRLHSSQLSNLRNRKLASPGPEVFLALGCCNQWLAKTPITLSLLAENQELAGAISEQPHALIDEEGLILGAGELLEIFVGLRGLPPGFDLRISEAEAPALSAALADLLAAKQPWRQCRERVMAAYGSEKRQKRERFAAVMAGLQDYTAAELDQELPELLNTLKVLDFEFSSIDKLLERLRQIQT
jgi:hypothetical protein